MSDDSLSVVVLAGTFTIPSCPARSTLTMADLLRTKRILQAQSKRHWTGHDKAKWVQAFPDLAKPWERAEIEVNIAVTGVPSIVDALEKMSQSLAEAVVANTALGKSFRAFRSRR